MAFAIAAPHAGFHPIARLSAAFTAYKADRKRRAAYDETVSELKKLTNRELWDLGIDRHEIERVAHDHVYKV